MSKVFYAPPLKNYGSRRAIVDSSSPSAESPVTRRVVGSGWPLKQND